MTRPLTVEAHLGLIYSVVQRYRRLARGALEHADLMQAGALGVMQAIKSFDPSRGMQFSTYATLWIRHYVQRTLRNEGTTVRVPVGAQQLRGAPRQPVSLNAPRANSESSLLDQLESAAPNPLELAELYERGALARRCLDCLCERERELIEGCVMGDRSLAEAARDIPNGRGDCISRERARQLKELALSRMRELPEIRQRAAE